MLSVNDIPTFPTFVFMYVVEIAEYLYLLSRFATTVYWPLRENFKKLELLFWEII